MLACLLVCLFVCLLACLLVCLFVCLVFIFLLVCLCVCLCLSRLSSCVCVWQVVDFAVSLRRIFVAGMLSICRCRFGSQRDSACARKVPPEFQDLPNQSQCPCRLSAFFSMYIFPGHYVHVQQFALICFGYNEQTWMRFATCLGFRWRWRDYVSHPNLHTCWRCEECPVESSEIYRRCLANDLSTIIRQKTWFDVCIGIDFRQGYKFLS